MQHYKGNTKQKDAHIVAASKNIGLLLIHNDENKFLDTLETELNPNYCH